MFVVFDMFAVEQTIMESFLCGHGPGKDDVHIGINHVYATIVTNIQHFTVTIGLISNRIIFADVGYRQSVPVFNNILHLQGQRGWTDEITWCNSTKLIR